MSQEDRRLTDLGAPPEGSSVPTPVVTAGRGSLALWHVREVVGDGLVDGRQAAAHLGRGWLTIGGQEGSKDGAVEIRGEAATPMPSG
jgi:hypothetical protein